MFNSRNNNLFNKIYTPIFREREIRKKKDMQLNNTDIFLKAHHTRLSPFFSTSTVFILYLHFFK